MRTLKDWLTGGLTLCFLLHLSLPAFATSIVALLGEKTITIAADGVAVGAPNKTGNITRSVCKILCKDLICFAAADQYHAKYNPFELAQKELDNPGTPREVSERFRTVITSLLATMFATAKKESPHQYEKYINEGLPMLSYLFAGFDNDGKPLIINSSAEVDPKGNILPISESTRKGEFRQIYLLSKGSHKYIDEYKKKNPKWILDAATNPTAFAEKLVRIEIEASEKDGSRDVGEPISIVSLTKKDGRFRVERSGNCKF